MTQTHAMYLETTSVFLTGSILSLGLILFSWALAMSYRVSRSFRFWAAGNTCVVAGIALLMSQGSLSPWVSIIVANSLLVGGLGLVARGLEAFADRLTAWGPAVAAYLVGMLVWALFTFVWPSYPVRAALLTLAVGVISFRVIRLLWSDLSEERVNTPWLIGTLTAVYLALTLGVLLNAIVVALNGSESIRVSGGAPILAYLIMLVSLMVWTFGFFSLVLFRDHRRLASVLATRDRMMALIAHDLRGPVGSVAAMLGMVRAPNLDEADRTQLIDASAETANEAVTLMETLLDWASAKQVKTSLVPEPLGARDLLASSMAPLMALAQTKGVLVATVPPLPPGLAVLADRRTVTTILRNLFSNALKFTPVGGTVGLSAQVDGDAVVLVVADTGPGLPPGLIERLGRGYTLTSTRGTAGEKGTGLGLSLCRDFAEANGSSLEFASSNQGTRVSLRLPKAQFSI